MLHERHFSAHYDKRKWKERLRVFTLILMQIPPRPGIGGGVQLIASLHPFTPILTNVP